MEVHAHTHTARKKWTHYFWEFLMLFFAVTAGFLVENMREHYVEHQREKQYAQSLYDDLKTDTFTLQRTYDEKKWIQAKFDSAENILASNEISGNNEFIYYVERYVTFNDVFTSQDVTYQQLRSSGNFRYFKNIELYKKIADYYNLYLRYQSIDGSFGVTDKNEMSEIESKIFNPRDLTSLDNYNATNFYDLALPSERKLEHISADGQMLKLLYIKVANAKYRSAGAKIFLGWLKARATDIMNELKKEYHLK
jgi:hypothetical protein